MGCIASFVFWNNWDYYLDEGGKIWYFCWFNKTGSDVHYGVFLIFPLFLHIYNNPFSGPPLKPIALIVFPLILTFITIYIYFLPIFINYCLKFWNYIYSQLLVELRISSKNSLIENFYFKKLKELEKAKPKAIL